jgi:hypothetical protein
MMKNDQPIPTTERLARALEAAGAPQARGGFYDEFKSDLATPIVQLVQDARKAGVEGIAERAIDGEFDATPEEGDEWMMSPEGQELMQQLIGEARQQKPVLQHFLDKDRQSKPKNLYSSRKKRRYRG